MDLQLALQAGTLLQAAYSHDFDVQSNYDGQTYAGFQVLQTIYADDLATDISKSLGLPAKVVSIGFVAQNIAAPSEYTLVIRGTEGIWEWIQDAKLLPTPFTAVNGAGLTEDGFTDMYMSFRTAPNAAPSSIAKALGGIFPVAATKVTICGHSLGSALATLLALDVAVNSPYQQPKVYTFASPRVGDLHFHNFFNSIVPECYRIANRVDLVTHIPLPPLFLHVGDETELVPGSSVINNPVCNHDIDTYMFLLAPQGNALNAKCIPAPPAVPAPAPVETGGA
jgi:Lipase (class 3)